MKSVLLLSVLLFFSGCTSMLFHPDTVTYSTPDEQNLSFETCAFESADGTRLHGWWITPSAPSKGLIVLAHGNAENLSSHYLGWVWAVEAGYELFVFDYRGYGRSEAKPVSLKAAVDDVKAALGYASGRYGAPFIAVGQSLGGALLINALETSPPGAIELAVIDSTYATLGSAGSDVLSRAWLTWPFQWAAYLVLDDGYDPLDRVGTLDIPKLFVAGSKDVIVSPNQSWRLFDAAARPRAFWLVQNAGHIQPFYVPQVRREFLAFLEHRVFHPDYSSMLIFDTIEQKKGTE